MTKSTMMRGDVSSVIAVQIIRGNLEQFALDVKVISSPASKTTLVGKFRMNDGKSTALRYLVNGNIIKCPNPDTFGASTRGDIAVPQIEEDLYASGAERVDAGKRYVTYSL